MDELLDGLHMLNLDSFKTAEPFLYFKLGLITEVYFTP